MPKIKTSAYCAIIAIITLAFSYLLCYGSEFTADLVITKHGQTTTGKIYVKGSRYRMEQKESGQDIVILVDQETKITRVFLPAKKMFLEMETTDPRSLMNDPFQGTKFMETRIKPKKIGMETINGQKCEMFVFDDKGKTLITEWISESLAFPVKIINHASSYSAEIRNISSEVIDEKLVAIPPGYSKAGESGAKVSKSSTKQQKEAQDKQKAKYKTQVFTVKGEGRDVDISSTERTVDPDKKLLVTIAANCPVRPVSKGKLSLYREGYQKVCDYQFTLKNGEIKNWEFPAEKEIKHLMVGIYGTGQAKVTLKQAE